MYHSKPYDKLLIVGNGFDRWAGLPSSYEEFRKYYSAHIEEALQELNIKKIKRADGVSVDPVTAIYGTVFSDEEMQGDFFWNFEQNLAYIDDQEVNIFFGRDGIDSLRTCVNDAQRLSRYLFCNWAGQLKAGEPAKATLPENAFYICFNYTDTLETVFGVAPEDICYIHGNCRMGSDSIIFGHSTHPETAFKELVEHNFIKPLKPGNPMPRIAGLYAVEEALYNTDKHVYDNIDRLCERLLTCGVDIHQIREIYVLGHSLADVDLEYFSYLYHATRKSADFESMSAEGQLDLGMQLLMLQDGNLDDDLSMCMAMDNVYYATHYRERVLKRKPIPFPKEEAFEKAVFGSVQEYDPEVDKRAAWEVRQRFLFEQAGRTLETVHRLASQYHIPDIGQECHSVQSLIDIINPNHAARTENAKWRISAYTAADKANIKKAARKIGLKLKDYTTYRGIEETLSAR